MRQSTQIRRKINVSKIVTELIFKSDTSQKDESEEEERAIDVMLDRVSQSSWGRKRVIVSVLAIERLN